MSCTAYLPNGSVDCKVPLAEVRHVILTTKTFSLGGLSAAYSFATWKAAVDTALTMWPLRGITSYEVTTDDVNIMTTQQGQKYVTNRPAPSALVYLDGNHCDYMDMVRNLKGGHYGVIYVLKNGQILVKRDATGNFKPFPARLTAVNKGVPLPGDITNNFPLHILHTDYDDFENAALIDPAWDFDNLILAIPAGLNMWITTAYTSGDVVVMVTDRGGSGRAGFAAADFEVLGSNYLTSPAVTALVDGGAGVYTLTIQKGAVPADLTAGDYVIIRVKDGAGPYTYLSNRLTVTA